MEEERQVVITDKLKHLLPEYHIMPGSSENLGDICEVTAGNRTFLAQTQCHEQTMEECEENLTARPAEVSLEQKHFLTIYRGDVCAALLDYLEGYPEADTVYLGLLIVRNELHGQHIGRMINDAFMRAAHECGFRRIRLGCYAANEHGYQFWRKNRYTAERITDREIDGQNFPLIHMVCGISDAHMFETEEERNTVYCAETKADYREADLMTKRAFWNKYVPGCNEHYLLHCLREDTAFIPELSIVAKVDGKIVGGIWYSKSEIKTDAAEYPVLTFGPLCVAPEYQGSGIGGNLLKASMRLAGEAGYDGIIIFGEPEYYPKHGFVACDQFGITTADGKNFPAFMGIELKAGAFGRMRGGKFYEAEVFHHLPQEKTDEFDKSFPRMEKLKLPGQWQ